LAPLFIVGVLWIAYLGLSGARGSVLGGPAYATALSRNLVDSVLMYAQWSGDLHGIAPDFGAERAGHSWLGGLWVLLPVVVGAWLIRRRSRLPLMGLAWWLAGLAPILPLLFQKHLHYLYSPSVGFALWIGSVAEVLVLAWVGVTDVKQGRVYGAWVAVVLLLLGHAVLSDSLIHKRYREQLVDVDLPADTFTRKMEIARRATSSIRASIGDRQARIVFYNPLIRGNVDFYAELLPAVLDQGRGLRALYPNIDSVTFVSRWTPADSAFEIFVANEDGRVMHFGRGPGANRRLIQTLAANGFEQQGAELLMASAAAYPDDPSLREMYLAYLGRTR
jgi:hypothetical protein